MTDINTYTTAEIANLTPQSGDLVLNTDDNAVQLWNGSAWKIFNSDVAGVPRYSLDTGYDITETPALHLDASILDGSDSANNPSDGTAVATWGDRSGNGNDFTEATNQPTFKASWLNGKPAVEFDGSNDVMSDSDFFSNVDFSAKDATMIIVYQPQDDSSYALTDTGSYSDDDRTYAGANLYSSSFLNTRIAGGVFNEKFPATRSASTFGLRIDNSAVSYKIYYNNRLQFDHTSYASSHFQTTGGAMKIGCGDSSYKLDGFISEVLVFNTALSDANFNTIHSYIDNKYKVHQYNNVTGSYALNGSYSTTVTPAMHFSAQSNLYKSDGSAPSNNEEVYAWTDKARGYHAIAGNAPVLNTNQINTSLNGVYFDGTDDYMDVFMLGMLGDFSNFDGTAIFLFEPDTDSAYEPVGIGGNSSGRLSPGGTNAYVDVFRASRLGGAPVTGYFTTTGVQLASIVSDATGNTYKIFKDGGSDVFSSAQSTSATAEIFNDNKVMRLGATTTTPDYYLKGWIYEVLVFDEPLSNANLNFVGNYLSSVYGTTYTDIT
jgi:hypothetical protein